MVNGPVKWDWTINAGHVLIFAGLVASSLYGLYAVGRTIDNHEFRINEIEKQRASESALISTLTQTMTDIKLDVGIIKIRLEERTRRDVENELLRPSTPPSISR